MLKRLLKVGKRGRLSFIGIVKISEHTVTIRFLSQGNQSIARTQIKLKGDASSFSRRVARQGSVSGEGPCHLASCKESAQRQRFLSCKTRRFTSLHSKIHLYNLATHHKPLSL